jgi:hypothetical protein
MKPSVPPVAGDQIRIQLHDESWVDAIIAQADSQRIIVNYLDGKPAGSFPVSWYRQRCGWVYGGWVELE